MLSYSFPEANQVTDTFVKYRLSSSQIDHVFIQFLIYPPSLCWSIGVWLLLSRGF